MKKHTDDVEIGIKSRLIRPGPHLQSHQSLLLQVQGKDRYGRSARAELVKHYGEQNILNSVGLTLMR